jgi:hypothetical protein
LKRRLLGPSWRPRVDMLGVLRTAMQPIIPGHGWHGRESSDAGWVTISSRSSLPVRRAGRCPWGFQANALCKDISVLPSTAVPERKPRCCERGVMNLSIDGHTHLLVPGLSNRPGQPRLLARKAHLAAATNRLAQCLPCLQRIRALCTKHSHPAGSWGLRRHRPRARTRSDQTRCGTRLVSASALPWQEPHAGAGDGNDASQWRRRMLPTIWGYSGSFSPLSLRGNAQCHCFCMDPSEDSVH